MTQTGHHIFEVVSNGQHLFRTTLRLTNFSLACFCVTQEMP